MLIEAGLMLWRVMQLPSKNSAAAAVVVMGLVWAALGGSLLLATEYLQDTHSKYVLANEKLQCHDSLLECACFPLHRFKEPLSGACGGT